MADINVFLERIDSVPIFDLDLGRLFEQWLTVLVNTINEDLDRIQENLRAFNQAPQLTSAEIIALAPDVPDGTFWYATDGVPPNVVIKINGVLVKLTTTPFP